MRRHRGGAAAIRSIAVCTAAAACALGASAGLAGTMPPPDTVSQDAPAPNFAAAYDATENALHPHDGGLAPSPQTMMITDPANGLLIEANGLDNDLSHCPASATGPYAVQASPTEWVSYDLATYKMVRDGCDLPSIEGQGANYSAPQHTNTAVVASSLRDVIVPCRLCEETNSDGPSAIAVVSEQTLTTVGTFCAAPGNDPTFLGPLRCRQPDGRTSSNTPYHYLHDISWYAPSQDIIAVTDNYKLPSTAPDGPLGVAVSDYHLAQDTKGALSVSLRWTVYLSPPLCGRSLSDVYDYTSAAYLSEKPGDPNLFVPCQARLSGAGDISPDQHTAIVRVPFDKGCACPVSSNSGLPVPVNNPSNSARAAIAPIDGEALMFDPAAERGYLLPPSSAEGFTIAVYDGTGTGAGAFIGRINGASGGGLNLGLDTTTGRLYLDDPVGTGMMVIDGRRTPVQPGRPYPNVGRSAYGGAEDKVAAIAGPDAAHPYTRVFESMLTGHDPNAGPVGRDYMSYVTVVADRVPLSQDPPSAQVDQNTYTGTVPRGATVSISTYTGHAAGYGFHSDLVGGYGGVLLNNVEGENAATTPQPPYDTKTIDTAAGVVEDSTARDGVYHGSATAFSDANGNATSVYSACSDLTSPEACVPASCANPLVDPSSPAHDPCGAAIAALSSNPPPSTTRQSWPYPEASCSQPGTGDPNPKVSGLQYTPAHSTSPDAAPPSPQTVPSSDATGAKAGVDCRNGQVAASGQYQCAGATPPAAPAGAPSPPPASPPAAPDLSPTGCDGKPGQVTIVGGNTTTLVTAPTPSAPFTSVSVTANAYGIHLALPDGTVVDIKQAMQMATATAGGLPGTASTTRQVVVTGITVTKPDEQPDVLCPASCTGSSTLLDTLNGLDPAHLYVTFPTPDEQFGVAGDGVSPKGSPGGYLATVQADPAEQGGDERWNAMTGFGGTEKALLPALRIILYDAGDVEVSREVLDLAGVEADAALGVDVNTDDTGTTTDVTQSMVDAGVPPRGTFVPGSDGTIGMPGQQGAAKAYPAGLQGVLERVLDGLRWLVRSPLGGLQMAAFLLVLGLPVAILRRRWTRGRAG